MPARRKKAYLALIAVGFGAMAVDRFVLRDAAPIEINDGPAEHHGSAVLASAVAGVHLDGLLLVPELPFPSLAVSAGDAPPVRDPFKQPGVASPDNTNGKAPADVKATSNAFGALHRLDGVWLQESLKIAIVDGAWVHIGQAVDGCTLKGVDGNEARFSCQDGEVTLRVGAMVGYGRR